MSATILDSPDLGCLLTGTQSETLVDTFAVNVIRLSSLLPLHTSSVYQAYLHRKHGYQRLQGWHQSRRRSSALLASPSVCHPSAISALLTPAPRLAAFPSLQLHRSSRTTKTPSRTSSSTPPAMVSVSAILLAPPLASPAMSADTFPASSTSHATRLRGAGQFGLSVAVSTSAYLYGHRSASDRMALSFSRISTSWISSPTSTESAFPSVLSTPRALAHMEHSNAPSRLKILLLQTASARKARSALSRSDSQYVFSIPSSESHLRK